MGLDIGTSGVRAAELTAGKSGATLEWRWLTHLVGSDDPRLARLREAATLKEVPVAAVRFGRRAQLLGD